MHVELVSGTGKGGCKAQSTSAFPSSTGNAFSTGSSPIMVTTGIDGSSIVTLTTQFSNVSFPMTTIVFRLDPQSLAPLWTFSPPAVPGCFVTDSSPTTSNILLADPPGDFYGGNSCSNDRTLSIMFSGDSSGALGAAAGFSSPASPFGGAIYPVALIKQDHGLPLAPCFQFSVNFACFSPADMTPLYPSVSGTDANFLSTSGGYLWQPSGPVVVGYSIAGFFAAPRAATYSTPVNGSLPPIRGLYSIPLSAGLSQPTALVYTNDGIALVQLTQVTL